MKLAVSNIAWAPEDACNAYGILSEFGIAGIEIAPGLSFAGEDDPIVPSDAAISRFRSNLAEFGLTLVSMQSLLFGVQGAQLFGTQQEGEALQCALRRVIALANRLSVPNLVFGSPGSRRYPDNMSASDAEARAITLFRQLGDEAVAAGTVLAIEPNPASYGTNFLTTVADAAAFVLAADHPGITLNLDLGAAHMNGEVADLPALYARTKQKVSHVHISEPQLAPAPANGDVIEDVALNLLSQGYDRWFSIEMRAPHTAALANLRECLARAARAMSAAEARAYA